MSPPKPEIVNPDPPEVVSPERQIDVDDVEPRPMTPQPFIPKDDPLPPMGDRPSPENEPLEPREA